MEVKRLPNGLSVWNATPHPLHFWCKGQMVVVPSDEVINVFPWTTEKSNTGIYTLNTVAFLPTPEGRKVLDQFKTLAPDALVVGSILAAQAYPGEVVAPIPAVSDRASKAKANLRLMRCDRFTIFETSSNKEISHASEEGQH